MASPGSMVALVTGTAVDLATFTIYRGLVGRERLGTGTRTGPDDWSR